ncbi:MAG: serine/threonine-protein kinase [Gammaproteobacteria bacterium]|nr:serine/threonine-protein kinase [Gammaproteobacteria bacterium]
MTARWDRIETLYTQAATLEGEERERYLEAECGEDRALREEVESLLEAGEQAETFFSGLARRAGLSGLSEDATGRRVGAWRLLQRLGHGGMGAVYLAERADRQFEKRVAIKLVPIALWGEEARRRFLLERQILARLEHLNIARLLDAGVNEDGVPYFVMEHVEGKPIDACCDENRLGVKARLELFLSVCDAVAYAHRNLIIHRDLKPANILVTETGTVKLLDFGIAKLVGAQVEEGLTLTRLGSSPLTPAYASPELLRGEAITTASDVYALGVLLYKLLCGGLPFDLAGLSETESLKRICGTTPALPSRAAATAKAASGPAPERLRRTLAGDLDTIVMKALRKEPERRYPSVEQLADDLRNYLAARPVRARPDTAGYRLSRFVKRHRIGVAATAALVALAIASGAVITTYAIRVTEQKNLITLQRNKAQQQQQFLVSIFNAADPGVARGETITAMELLDSAAVRLDTELSGQPKVKADMLNQLGIIYFKLSSYEKARTLLERALALNTELYGKHSPETIESLKYLGLVVEYAGDFDYAKSLYQRALTTSLNAGPDGDGLVTASILNHLGRVEMRDGHFEKADDYLRRAHALLRGQGRMESALAGDNLKYLGVLEHRRGNDVGAESYFREALTIFKGLYGDRHPAIAQTLNNLGIAMHGQGRNQRAEAVYRKVLAMQNKLYGGPQELTITTLYNLTSVLREEGRLDEAIATIQAAITMGRQLWGDSHSDLGIFYSRLGSLLTLDKRYVEAEQVLNKALEIHAATKAPNHFRTGIAHEHLGRLHAIVKKYARAEKHYRQALAIYRVAYPPGHWRIGSARSGLGNCLRAEKKYAQAQPLLLAGYRTLDAKLGPDDPLAQTALQRLVRFYEETGDAARAAQYRKLIEAPRNQGDASRSPPRGG